MDTIRQSVLYGDCRTILPTLEAGTFDLCLTDPPYAVGNWDTGFGTSKLKYGTKPPLYREWLWEVKRTLKGNGQLVVFENQALLVELIDEMRRVGFKFRAVGLWHASNRQNYIKGPFYRNHCDIWVWAVKTGGRYTFNYLGGEEMCELFQAPTVMGDSRVPGAKPLDLIERFVKVHTNPGDRVLDPFLGSGTTLLACRRTGRNGVGIEVREELKSMIDARLHEKVSLEKYISLGSLPRDRKTRRK